MDTTQILYLGDDDVDNLATFDEAVSRVREAYRERGDGAPAVPKTSLPNVEYGHHFKSYTAILPEQGVMGGYFSPVGASFKLISLFNARTGSPLALISGGQVNPLKTGACGGVAIDTLSRPDAETITLFGSGRQARAQLLAAMTVRDISTVYVYSRSRSNRERFASRMDESIDASVVAVDDGDRAVERSDIVITATSSSQPVFDGDRTPDGCHINAIGQHNPYKRELDTTVVRHSKYVPDLSERVRLYSGSYLQALHEKKITDRHIYGELGEIISGKLPGRKGDEVTVFDSGGTAIETIAVAALLFAKAVERGYGQTLEFSSGQ